MAKHTPALKKKMKPRIMTGSTISSFRFKPIPTFRILSYKTAVRFYVDYLGFSIDWEQRLKPVDPVYMQVSYNELILHLSEFKQFDTNTIVFVETSNIRAFHNELKARNAESTLKELEVTKWQTMQLEIEDPFGNLLRFNENVIEEDTTLQSEPASNGV